MIDVSVRHECVKRDHQEEPKSPFHGQASFYACRRPLFRQYLRYGTKIWGIEAGKSPRPLDKDWATNPPKDWDLALRIQGSHESRGTDPSFIFDWATHWDWRYYDCFHCLRQWIDGGERQHQTFFPCPWPEDRKLVSVVDITLSLFRSTDPFPRKLAPKWAMSNSELAIFLIPVSLLLDPLIGCFGPTRISVLQTLSRLTPCGLRYLWFFTLNFAFFTFHLWCLSALTTTPCHLRSLMPYAFRSNLTHATGISPLLRISYFHGGPQKNPTFPMSKVKGWPRCSPLLWRRHLELNQGIAVLQTVALPLGYAASKLPVYRKYLSVLKEALGSKFIQRLGSTGRTGWLRLGLLG